MALDALAILVGLIVGLTFYHFGGIALDAIKVRKVGGIRFVTIGRLSGSYSIRRAA
jgi:hypothetical protein